MTMSESREPVLHRPLAGLRVLDLTVALAGPYCTMLLGGLGAEVIKIESPRGSDIARGNPPFFGPQGLTAEGSDEAGGVLSLSVLLRSRNKASLALDLKSEEGRALFLDLVEQADIVVENQSEGSIERLGIGYEVARARNPRIIYASIEGLGPASPYPGMNGTDIIVQAVGGLMDVTGFAEGPPLRVGLPVADLAAPLFALSGLLAAVIQRQTTGRGQHIRVSLLETTASLLAVEHFDVLAASGQPPRTGNHHNRVAPFGLFRAADGHVAIAAPSDALCRTLFQAIGQEQALAEPAFATRGARALNADRLNRMIEDWTVNRSTAEIVETLFVRHRVPCARLRSAAETLADPALRETGAVVPLAHPTLGPVGAAGPGIPIRFSDAQAGLERPAVALGTDSRAILRRLLKLPDAELDRLHAAGIIRSPEPSATEANLP